MLVIKTCKVIPYAQISMNIDYMVDIIVWVEVIGPAISTHAMFLLLMPPQIIEISSSKLMAFVTLLMSILQICWCCSLLRYQVCITSHKPCDNSNQHNIGTQQADFHYLLKCTYEFSIFNSAIFTFLTYWDELYENPTYRSRRCHYKYLQEIFDILKHVHYYYDHNEYKISNQQDVLLLPVRPHFYYSG